MAESPRQWADRFEENEAEQVRLWRREAARRVGLSKTEAARFADGEGDIGLLRDASKRGATHDQLVEIFT